MTREQLGTLAALLDGFMCIGNRPMDQIRNVVENGFVGARELLDAAAALAKETGTDAFVEDEDLSSLL